MAGETAPAAPAPIVPGSPEHNAAMAAKADSVNATGDPALPKGGAHAQPPADPAPPADEKPVEGEKPTDKPTEEKPADEKPAEGEKPSDRVDVKALTAEYSEKGEFSEETYKSLESKGFDKAFVDQFVEGQKAIASQRDAIGYEAAGGKSKFDAMSAWAGENLTPAEIDVVNKGLRGTPEEMRSAVRGLKSSYDAQFGSEPELVGGRQGAESRPSGAFESRAQATAAIKDPRYKNDPAYRRSVEQRIGSMQDW